MKVLVDAREAVRNKSGIGVVARQIVARLSERQNEGIEFLVVKPSEKRLSHTKVGKLFEFLWWKAVYVRFLAFRNGCDLIFSLDPINAIFSNKCISIIYDMIFFVYPNWTNVWGKLWRTLIPFTINKNRFLFSISNNTTNDIKKYIPSFDANIPVVEIKLGYNREIFNSSNTSRDFLTKYGVPIDLPYVMFVGNAEPRRNLIAVIRALGCSNQSTGRNDHLVVAGKNEVNKDRIMEEAERYGVKDRLHIVGYLSDDILAQFYKCAQVYVYPSFYEGFGLTIIEAMACGCPVITSNNSSLKDVAGTAALLVDPSDQDSINTSLAKVLTDDGLRKNLIAEGYRNILQYDWDKMTETIIRSIKELGGHANNN